MPYPPWASPSQCFQVLSPAQPPQAANLLLGRGAWMGHISGLPNDRALENYLYLKQVVAQVLMVQGSLLGRELVSRLCSTSSFGNLFTASPSSSFPHRQFLTTKKKKQHGLKNTIPAKRSACLCPCRVCAALHPFLPLLSLGVQRLQSLKLAYPTHNCSCLGKMGFQKDLVLLMKC